MRVADGCHKLCVRHLPRASPSKKAEETTEHFFFDDVRKRAGCASSKERLRKSRATVNNKIPNRTKKICAHLMQQARRQCGSILKFWKTKKIRQFADIVPLNFLEGECLRRLSAHQACHHLKSKHLGQHACPVLRTLICGLASYVALKT